MADREPCLAVGFDWHGTLVERQVPNISGDPLRVVEVAMENAARAYGEAFKKVFGRGLEAIDPQELWELEQAAWTEVWRGGRIARSHHKVLVRVNELTWARLLEAKGNITHGALRRLAMAVREARRDSSQAPYAYHDDMRVLIERVHNERQVPMHIVTGQTRERVQEQGRECKVPLDWFGKIISAPEFGTNKLSISYWYRVLKLLRLNPHQFLVIGNEVTIDAACTRVGIPVIIFDRGGVKQRFFRHLAEAETRYGVPFRAVDQEIHRSDPFIGFATTTEELWRWFERIPMASETPLFGPRRVKTVVPPREGDGKT